MEPDQLHILEYCALIAVGFWFIGVAALSVAVKKAKPEFRVKGYLRTPRGSRWFRFLLYKQYDSFDNPSTRFFFGVTHICLLGTFLALGALVVLVGSEVMLRGLASVK